MTYEMSSKYPGQCLGTVHSSQQILLSSLHHILTPRATVYLASSFVWIARRSNLSILKEINPEYSLEGLMLKLKLQYFGHLMQRNDSLEKDPEPTH